MQITTIGLDLAKSVFQVHGIDATGQVVVRKSLRRSQILPFFAKLPSSLVGMEACGTSHYWARELIKLGHEVRLMPPAYVKPYVKRGKTDAADAEAVCEAVTRPTMRFVPVKSPEQQAALSITTPDARSAGQAAHAADQHDPRSTGRIWRRHPQGTGTCAADGTADRRWQSTGCAARSCQDRRYIVTAGARHPRSAPRDRPRSSHLATWQRCCTSSHDDPRYRADRRATALAASVTDPHQFRSGRQFAAWLGLTPLQKSSGGKERLGRITKMGDKYLRKLLVVGMTALVRRARQNPEGDPRLADLLARKPTRVATVAMANKTARIIWAIMTRGETYHAGHRPALAA